MYNDRRFTAGSKAARAFAIIVEFHKDKALTYPMELSNGYKMELGGMVRLNKRAGNIAVKEQDKTTKQLRLYKFARSYAEERWKGKTQQDQFDDISRTAQAEINGAIAEFMDTDGAKFD